MTTPARPACCLCAHQLSNEALLLWDVATDQRYCADQTECWARRLGHLDFPVREVNRCTAWRASSVGVAVSRCLLDPGHSGRDHADVNGNTWKDAA